MAELARLLIAKIISGGQTGVDRAALDAAIELDIPCGGWCPRGRLAEDRMIPDRYPLKETASADYAARTEQNIVDADGTLIIATPPITGGTALTIELARRLGKPCFVIDPGQPPTPDEIATWLAHEQIEILNIAGPRESKQPGIYDEARHLLLRLFNNI